MTKITLEEIDGMTEAQADALLNKALKKKRSLEKQSDSLRKIIGRLHARLDILAKFKTGRNG